MPIFMDRHDVPGITAEDVAKAHRDDLKIQEKYNCKALTYWFDKDRGTAFCLIEAPDKQAVKSMHTESHGLIPHRITEVESGLVEAFLGRMEDPKPNQSDSSSGLLVFEDPAFRAIMAIDFKKVTNILSKTDHTAKRKHLKNYKKIIQIQVHEFGGREVKWPYEGVVASFSSVPNAVKCAINTQKRLNEYNSDVNLLPGIGLHAGEPLTDKTDFFEDTIQLAKRLSHIATGGKIHVSSTIRELYQKEELEELSERKDLKSLSSKEEQFLNRLMDATEKVWDRNEYKIKDYCKHIGVSKSQLYREIKNLTGQSPTRFIMEFRLNQAISLLKKKPGSIAEVAYKTGFNNPSYFTKCFKEKFGFLPSKLLKAN